MILQFLVSDLQHFQSASDLREYSTQLVINAVKVSWPRTTRESERWRVRARVYMRKGEGVVAANLVYNSSLNLLLWDHVASPAPSLPLVAHSVVVMSVVCLSVIRVFVCLSMCLSLCLYICLSVCSCTAGMQSVTFCVIVNYYFLASSLLFLQFVYQLLLLKGTDIYI